MMQPGRGRDPALLSLGLTLLLGSAGLPEAEAQTKTCSPSRPQEIQLIVAEAEDFLAQGNVRESLVSVDRGETTLPCLTDSVAPDSIGSLYLIKAAGLYRSGSKGRRDAEAAFRQAFLYDADLECQVPGLVSGAEAACLKARQDVVDGTLVAFDLINHHSGALIYVDGRRQRPERRGLIDVDLMPGTHFLQVLSDDGFFNRFIEVSASRPTYDLTEVLGPVPEVSDELKPGSIRLEGLPADASVIVDGRERRDLPILQQIDPGDHYLKVSSPTTGVMGFNVRVEPGQETVYAVVLTVPDAGRSGGGGKMPAFVSYGAAAAFAAGAGATFALSAGAYGEADAAFDTYLSLSGDPSAIAEQYQTADDLQRSGNTLRYASWGLGGAAVLAGAAGTFLLLRGDSGLARGPVQILPFAGPADGRLAGGLQLSGRF